MDPGVTVLFLAFSDDRKRGWWQNRAEIEINREAKLVAAGTPENPIVFASTRSPAGPTEWGSIRFSDTGNGTVSNCSVMGATYGVHAQSPGTSPIIENCSFSANEYGVVASNQAAPIIARNSFIGNRNDGINVNNAPATISDNVVRGHNNNGIYISARSGPEDRPTVEGNKVSKNRQGIYMDGFGASIVSGNTSARNTNEGIVYSNHENRGDAYPKITDNTIVGNGNTGIYLQGPFAKADINRNNLLGNRNFDLFNVSETNQDATSNYWGPATTDEMEAGGNPKNIRAIYDRFDDPSRGEVDYSNWLNEYISPVSAPTGLTAELVGNDIALSWSPNPEPELAGYKVHYGTKSGFPYERTGAIEGDSPVDVGNVTSFTLTGLTAAEEFYLAITAYNDLGDQSFFSEEQKVTLLPPPSNLQKTSPDNDNTPTFIWDAAEGAAAYQVSVNDEAFKNIGSVLRYTHRTRLPDGDHVFRVRTRHVSGSVSAEASLDFVVDTVKPTAPGELTMDPPSPTKDNTPTFTWTAAVDATSKIDVYQVSIDGEPYADIVDVLIASIAGPETNGTADVPTTFTPADPLEDGQHNLKVRARDEAGNIGLAATIDFIVDTVAPANPPDVVMDPSSPSNDNTPTFSWAGPGVELQPSAVNNSDVSSYEVSVDSGDFMDVGEVLSYTPEVAIPDGDHTIAVRARDAAGNTSDSALLDFSIDTVAPSAPGTPEQATPIQDGTPTFVWTTAADDEGSGIGYYEFDLDQSGDFTVVGDVLTYTFKSRVPNGPHLFEVRAVDKAGNVGPISFTIADIDAIALDPPQDLTIDPPSPTNDSTPIIRWTGSPDASSHEISLDSEDFTDIGLETEYEVPNELAEGEHTFAVRSKDVHGNATEPTVLDFVVDTVAPTAPGTPSLITPKTDGTPTFTWEASTDIDGSGIDYYEYDLDRTGTFTNIGSDVEYAFEEPVDNGSHFFEIRAVDHAGNVSPSRIKFFSIAVPPVPVPEDLTMDPPSPTNDDTPIFSWDPVPEAHSYEVRLDAEDYLDIGDTTGYGVPVPLLDGSHTFEVRTVDGSGNKSPAAALEFVVDTVAPSAPGTPELTTPLEDNTPTFTWEAATDDTSGVDSYEYDLDQTGVFTNIGDILEHTILIPVDNGTHLYELRAVDKAGNTGPVSFKIFDIEAAPYRGPTNLTMDPESPTSDNTPTFSWDSDGDAVFYEVSMDSEDFEDIGDATSYKVTDPLLDGSHTFQVRWVDNDGVPSDIAVLEFVVDTVAPSAPGDLSVTTPKQGNTPTFTWIAATDETSGVNYYEYDLNQTGEFTDIGDGLTFTFEVALENRRHLFALRAVDGAGNVGQPAISFFTVESTELGTPQDLAMDPPSPTNVDMPFFSWSAVEGADSYEIRLDSSDFMNIGDAIEYEVTNALVEGDHTFEVRATDDFGNNSPAAMLEFIVDTVPPTEPGELELTTPSDDNTPTLTLIHRRTACRRPAEETEGCASESGIMVLKQKTGPRKGAPDRCYHVTTPTASKSPSTTTTWWPMPG